LFDWKKDGMHDVGFGAEDVAKINTLFVTYNNAGQVEGVKYDRLSTVFVNAFIEQQSQIERQQEEIKKQQSAIESLKRLVCVDHRNADACKAP
jgi:phage terminase large subunit-like protein